MTTAIHRRHAVGIDPDGGMIDTIYKFALGVLTAFGGWWAISRKARSDEQQKAIDAETERKKTAAEADLGLMAHVATQVKDLQAWQREDRAALLSMGGEIALLKGELAIAKGELLLAKESVARLEKQNVELVAVNERLIKENHNLQERNRELMAERRNDMQIGIGARELAADIAARAKEG